MGTAAIPTEGKTLFTIEELTSRWSLSRSKIYELLDDNRIAAVKIGSARRVHLNEVLRFEASLT
ncbi:excisionase family DNA-binding protein [Schlesneria sp. T3-172]|uniref:excisionase family DNA-binding protein n=1 Tax=Schlesneria sphaerica TaxID=3373610 RepID=UPI0037C7D775